MSLNDTYELRNGVKIPCIGYGTWQAPDDITTEQSVESAVRLGYRHIDTAAAYDNEQSVGRGIANSGVSRRELFITSKVWNSERGYERTLKACEKTLKDLNLDYLDLYLIHWPAASRQFTDWEEINRSTWMAMIELYRQGKVRAIGVSNFKPHHLSGLMKTEIPPMVDQIEYHPGMLQAETVAYCRENNILVEGWSALGTGRMLQNESLIRLAARYGKSAAQLCIRWAVQQGILPLPKSVTPSRIAENAAVFDFSICAEDMDAINRMPYSGGSGLDPDKIDF